MLLSKLCTVLFFVSLVIICVATALALISIVAWVVIDDEALERLLKKFGTGCLHLVMLVGAIWFSAVFPILRNGK